jgi:uncharacterized protein with gpF-like domain
MARPTDKQADRAFESILRRQESILQRKLNANFNQLSKDIQAAMESHDIVGAEAVVSINDLALAEILAEAYERGNREGARMAARDVEEDDDTLIEEAVLLALLFWRSDTASAVSKQINRTTQKIFNKVLLEAQEEGLAGDELSREVAKRTKADNRNRSTTIATTESQRGIQTGSQKGAEAAQEKIVKAWRTQGDRRVRPTHRAANGQTRELDETFNIGSGQGRFPHDSMLPRSETINCRCYVRFKKVKI